jgi:hypothetical protein
MVQIHIYHTPDRWCDENEEVLWVAKAYFWFLPMREIFGVEISI